jgi:ankyrin repeat protein
MVAMATQSAGAQNWVLTSYAVYRGRLLAAGATALMAAAGRGRDAEVSALLANGADVRLASLDGSTAAGWAARCAAMHAHNSPF